MKFKDWLKLIIGVSIGAGTLAFFKWVYSRLKKGKFDKFLSKEEKENLMSAIEEFIKNSEEE